MPQPPPTKIRVPIGSSSVTRPFLNTMRIGLPLYCEASSIVIAFPCHSFSFVLTNTMKSTAQYTLNGSSPSTWTRWSMNVMRIAPSQSTYRSSAMR